MVEGYVYGVASQKRYIGQVHRVYTVSALKLGFRWDLTVQTPVILLKNIFEFMFNMARSTLYR